MSDVGATLLGLMSERDGLEAEADAIHSELSSPGPNGEPPAGLKSPLVDAEGFPRGDIDLYRVSHLRNRLAIINTDHKSLMKTIEKTLHSMHKDGLEEQSKEKSVVAPVSSASASTSTAPTSSVMSTATILAIPIAKVGEVMQGSPAEEAGLCNGDSLLAFGTVTARISNPLSQIPAEVSRNVNGGVDLVVRRNGVGGEVLTLTLRPRVWGGAGMVGCHLAPPQ
jgi:26S proteasome regulatory subunit N4